MMTDDYTTSNPVLLRLAAFVGAWEWEASIGGLREEERQLLATLAAQTRLAIDRSRLVAHNQALSESDRQKSALLAAVLVQRERQVPPARHSIEMVYFGIVIVAKALIRLSCG